MVVCSGLADFGFLLASSRESAHGEVSSVAMFLPRILVVFSAQFTFLLDDVGIPANYRFMEGFGVHAFKLINKAGRETYVKFHWIPTCGVKCLADDLAVQVGGKNHSHATQDLYESIAAGNYPEWTLKIQTMDPVDQHKFDFDPLDVTKIWPEHLFPLQPVGRMVLNQNVDNFFSENESLAFCPALVVPGVTYSEDKLLQTRIFSYADTQRYRLGANYLMLPVNAPKCPFHNNHHDGAMNFTKRSEEVNYFPSRSVSLCLRSFGRCSAISRHDAARHAAAYPTSKMNVTGSREKVIIEKEDNFTQPGDRYRSWDPARQERFRQRFLQMLLHPRTTKEIRR